LISEDLETSQKSQSEKENAAQVVKFLSHKGYTTRQVEKNIEITPENSFEAKSGHLWATYNINENNLHI